MHDQFNFLIPNENCIEEETIAETIHIRKVMKIRVPRSKSPPDRQWGEGDSPQAASPNSV
ncbi:hypothetical protein AXX17_AT3G13720 [Arabidopsis thaliana]|jgi:hypothetical protein|uniref:Uncharacterized protein n=1 Tax=Arabidopsis thaliana TaxID=3702 RepID=A0A178VBT1_ARATH|nr:hypothetical protein AXX17_AT3G13720 [Arabidopsis thaliana]